MYWGAESPGWAGFVSGVCIGAAYLTKEPALFVAPALMIDALARREWRLLSGIAAGLLLIVGLEHTYYLAVTGDLMFRPHAMVQHNQSSYVFQLNQHLGWRLFKAYPKIMLLPTTSFFGLHSLFAIAFTVRSVLSFDQGKMEAAASVGHGALDLSQLWDIESDSLLGTARQRPLSVVCLSAALFVVCGGPHSPAFGSTEYRSLTDDRIPGGCRQRLLLRICEPRTRVAHRCRQKSSCHLADVAKSRNLHTVVVEEGDSQVWGSTLAILDHDLRQLNDPPAADLVVRPDASGLPSISASRP